jgi:hypothetical protein
MHKILKLLRNTLSLPSDNKQYTPCRLVRKVLGWCLGLHVSHMFLKNV